MKHVAFRGRMVIVGFGSIGQGVLPLILRHIEMDRSQITIVTAEERGHDVANEYGVKFIVTPLRPGNYQKILDPLLGEGDYLLNVSVDVSSVALMKFCRAKNVLYQDTCIEPWAGGYTDPSLSLSLRSNYALRETALKLRNGGKGPTALVTHGANPGLVSHFVKQALLNIARDTGVNSHEPACRQEWGELMRTLSVKVIHIAERDTQVSHQPKAVDEFVNTWSIDGFVGEGCQPAELGWGSHEKNLPRDGAHHAFGCDSAIYLRRPGAATRVRSWTPQEGSYHGFLITHGESISIADYYTIREDGAVSFRPTTHYAYHPCDAAVLSLHELAGKNWKMQSHKRLMMDDISSGIDELGVLLMGHAKGGYWYGSRLDIDEARRLAPHNNATSLQVTSTVLGGIVYSLEHPNEGLIEPDDIDFKRILEIAQPYLGTVEGTYTDWTPLQERGQLFPEELDASDPWQFRNFLVA